MILLKKRVAIFTQTIKNEKDTPFLKKKLLKISEMLKREISRKRKNVKLEDVNSIVDILIYELKMF